MKTLRNLLPPISVLAGLAVGLAAHANSFNLQNFDIDGARIGDSQDRFLRNMSQYFPARAKQARRASKSSLLYTRPVSCRDRSSGLTRCTGTFAEMKQPVNGRQKEFIAYRDVVANFNQNNELAFLSNITTTRHKDGKSCLKALSKFYQQAVDKPVKPLVIYPRNQLDIYYIKIDEQPFATRMLGKLDSAFSMVWQKKRNDWSQFYSVDFGCRDNGYMVVNSTLYDQALKSGSKFQGFKVSRFQGFKVSRFQD